MNLISRSIRRIRKNGFRDFFRSVYGYLHIDPLFEAMTTPFIIGRAKKDFRERSKGINSVKELVDFSFDYHYLTVNIRPCQIKKEITDFRDFVKSRKVKKVMEIGTDRGGTLFLLSRVSGPKVTIVSVSYQMEKLYVMCAKQRVKLMKEFPTRGQSLHLVNGNSHNKATLTEVKRVIGNKKLDVLFIDADHTYNGVKMDHDMYAPLVRKGGIIAFHDITGSASNRINSTSDYWHDVKKRYANTREFAVPGGFGIGMIIK